MEQHLHFLEWQLNYSYNSMSLRFDSLHALVSLMRKCQFQKGAVLARRL
jgi:hypothetical protein